MNDVVMALNAAANQQEAGTHDGGTIGFERLGPDHEITNAEFVFEGNEHNSLGAAGALAHQHYAGNRDGFAIGGLFEPRMIDDTLSIAHLTKETHRMGLQRKLDG